MFCLLVILPFTVFCHTTGTSSKSKNLIHDTLGCHLIWDGIVFDTDSKTIQGATVSVFQDTVLVEEMTTNKNGKCLVYIGMNTKVKIIISYPDYVSKILIIDTTVPFTKCSVNFSIPYSVYLFKYQKGVDVEILKNPIATIQYDPKIKKFSFDAKQVKKINNMIIDRYEEYNQSLLHPSKK